MKVKSFAPLQRLVMKVLADISSKTSMREKFEKTLNVWLSWLDELPTSQKCTELQVNVFRKHLKSWSTSCRIDQAQFGTLLLLSCSHGAFIWLQVALKIAAWSTTNISTTSTVFRSWYFIWVTSIFIRPSFVNDQLFDHPPPKRVKAKREIP